MAKTENTMFVLSPVGRLWFSSLFVPRAFKGKSGKEQGDKHYDTQLIFDPADIANFEADLGNGALEKIDINQICANLARAEWPGVDLKVAFSVRSAIEGQPDKVTWPIKNGDTLAAEMEQKAKKKGGDYKHITGKKVIGTKSKETVPPTLFVYENNQMKTLDRNSPSELAKAKSLFVDGNYVRAEMKVVPSLVDSKYFLTFYLNSVVFVRKGDPIRQMSMMQRFDGIVGGQAAHDPTKGLNDAAEIPF